MTNSRSWCLTVFQYEEASSWLTEDDVTPDLLRYAIWQEEDSPDTGRRHLQAYCEFHRPVRRNRAQQLLHADRSHIEVRRATREQAKAYCCKEDTRHQGPYEVGNWSRDQGHRSDLSGFISILQDTGLAEAIDSNPSVYVKYHRGLHSLLQQQVPLRVDPPTVIVLWGSTGVGKTRHVYDHHPTGDVYTKMPQNKWWDGYTGQPVVLIDDFDGKSIDYTTMLRLLDRHPCLVEVKGGTVNMNSSTVFITSNIEPKYWYDDRDELTALMRRITQVIHKS